MLNREDKNYVTLSERMRTWFKNPTDWDDEQLGVGAMTVVPKHIRFSQDRCLGEYIGYANQSIQL